MGALLGTITSSASNVIYLKDKTLAEWVALNRLTEIRIAQQLPDKGKRTGNAEMGGMRWQWEEEVTELPRQGHVPRRRARAAHRRNRRRSRARDEADRADGGREQGQRQRDSTSSTGPRP